MKNWLCLLEPIYREKVFTVVWTFKTVWKIILSMYPFRNFSECQKPVAKRASVAKRAKFCGKVAKRARWGNSAPMVVNKPKVVHSSIVMTSQGWYFYLKRLKMKIMAYRDISSIWHRYDIDEQFLCKKKYTFITITLFVPKKGYRVLVLAEIIRKHATVLKKVKNLLGLKLEGDILGQFSIVLRLQRD